MVWEQVGGFFRLFVGGGGTGVGVGGIWGQREGNDDALCIRSSLNVISDYASGELVTYYRQMRSYLIQVFHSMCYSDVLLTDL